MKLRWPSLLGCLLSSLLTCLWLPAVANEPDPYRNASGKALMEAVYQRHQQYPWVFETQSMIMIDQFGRKNTRKLRRYSRMDEAGNARFLLLFDSPVDVKGVALLANRDSAGVTEQSFYLPAFGNSFITSESNGTARQQENFLGTDYTIQDLVGEVLEDHDYQRRPDELIDETPYYVVDSFYRDETPEEQAEDIGQHAPARHYIRKDNLFIDRTDQFDMLGRLRKRQTQHDLVNVHGDMWRANMMMMENLKLGHRTVIKINERVFSADYVPEEVFTRSWIIQNQPFEPPKGATQDSDIEVADRD